MYAFAHDKALGAMVGMLVRPFDEEADNARVLESIAKQQADSLNLKGDGIFILVVDREYPNPSAKWRKKFAESRDNQRFGRILFAVATPATHLHGVLTAINWVRPPTQKFEAESFLSFDEAMRWVEGKRGNRLPVLQRLYDEVQEKLGYPNSSGVRSRPSSPGDGR
jgi:hypothetical protein